MADRPIKTFHEFWPYYLREHRGRATRAFHYAGTASGLAAIALAATVDGWILAAAPFAAYGPAWVGHFFIERNRPASFKYRRWSLAADLRMFALFLTGQLGPHLREAEKGENPAARRAAAEQGVD